MSNVGSLNAASFTDLLTAETEKSRPDPSCSPVPFPCRDGDEKGGNGGHGGYADKTRVVTSLGSINDFGRMGKKWLSP